MKPQWSVSAMAACAVAVRPDWDLDDITGALITAQHNPAWTPARALIALGRLMADPQGAPRDLRAEARHPLDRQPITPAARTAAIAQARSALSAPRNDA